MRRLALAFALTAAIAAPIAASAAAPTQITVAEAAGAKFPSRVFTLGLSKKLDLDASRITVTENGRSVTDIELAPAAETNGSYGVVLAIDASNSMRGAPIRNAVAAARAFLATRKPKEQVAIVTFNRVTRVVLPFTTDAERMSEALTKVPALAEGTHIYDAIQGSLELLQHQKITAGSIVLLSDGADTGSRVRRVPVQAAVGKAHVRVFTIGLHSSQFAPGPLRRLAAGSGGTFAEATTVERLTPIYRQLGKQLSNEYLLRYKSLAGPKERVNVRVAITGVAGAGRTAYVSPSLDLAAPPTYHRSAVDRLLQSPLAMLLIALAVAGLITWGLLTVARPTGRGLRRRMGEFVSIGHDVGERHSAVAGRVFAGTERGLERMRWWGRFKEEVELAEISMPPVQIVLWSVVGALIVGWLFVQLTGTPLAWLVGAFVPVGARELISRRVTRKRRLFADQLPDNLQVVASAMRAGHSLVGAMSVLVEDAAEPTKTEFRRVIADERLGIPLEDALEVVVRRMESRELAQVALVAALQRQTGGNAAEVLDRVVDLIRERAELRRLVRTLTAQGRMSRWILTALPLVLLGAILVIAPDYLSPLFHKSAGRLMLMGAGVMVIIGSLVIRRIVDIKV